MNAAEGITTLVMAVTFYIQDTAGREVLLMVEVSAGVVVTGLARHTDRPTPISQYW